MGKKSERKSNVEKKSTAKKQATRKKSVEASGAKEKDLKQKGKTRQGAVASKKTAASTKKAAPVKKAAAPAKKAATVKKAAAAKKAATRSNPKAEPKLAAKANGKKAAAARKPKDTAKDLLFRKFAAGAVDKVSEAPHKKEAPLEIPDAAPFVSGHDEQETKRIRALLFKHFDPKDEPAMEEIKEAAPVEEAAQPAPEVFKRQKYETPNQVLTGRPHPMAGMVKGGLCGLAALVAVIIVASFLNTGKFYLENVNGAVQVWRGRFSPTGKELVLSLDGMEASRPLQAVYSETEIRPLVFGYFRDKADAILNEPGWGDFTKIKEYLHQAASYAPTGELREMVQLRLDDIDFLMLLHRADVALGKGKIPDLEAAKTYLDKAVLYASRDYQRDILGKTKAAVEGEIAALEAK